MEEMFTSFLYCCTKLKNYFINIIIKLKIHVDLIKDLLLETKKVHGQSGKYRFGSYFIRFTFLKLIAWKIQIKNKKGKECIFLQF